MRIIRNVSGAAEAEQRLIATMYNIERAVQAVDDRGEPLSAPFAPFPTYTVKPTTTKGLPVTYHIKATVGVVFYTAGTGFQLLPLINRLRDGLAKFGYQHLTAYSATSVSPCVTVRKMPSLDENTHVTGPRKPYRKPHTDKPDTLPARLMMFTPPLHDEVPPHISFRARFTWVFMPIGAIVNLKVVSGAEAFNALVSSALYDDAGIVGLDNNAIVSSLSSKDIASPSLPKSFRDIEELLHKVVFVADISARATRKLELSFTAPGPDTGVSRVAGAVTPWSSLRTYQDETKVMTCFTCTNPLWGDVFAIVDPRMPSTRDVDGTWGFVPFDGIPPNDPILDGRSVGICRHCARNICAGVDAHLACRVVRSQVARTHDEAFGGGECKALLAITQAAEKGFAPIPDMPGYFLVGETGKEFVLKPAGGGSWSCTAIPQISSRPILEVPGLIVMS